ncbi:DUF887-domain-containing protein [Fimicolochytrium jonesii]|uniref:DUF887-domain-containing protein n=1 Tax=Fimicolochytrium jonesii TaxID=1396493 RepID=UPI0022FDC77D|nr:DUF887-domain-containing protein [Fimicolochytrium jonesii]KAI8819611.1 DUF887-domain-containing protein [Fimicolochytrium jonesii]
MSSGPLLSQQLPLLLAQLFHLPKLAIHGHIILLSAFVCHTIYRLSNTLSLRLPGPARAHYARLTPAKKADWCIHVVSLLHSVIICWLAGRQVLAPWIDPSGPEALVRARLAGDKIGAYDAEAGFVHAIACGYFLWDSIVSVYYVKQFGVGFAVHGIACLCIFAMSFKPFLNYYGTPFLLFELSTPFLNIHWFCDKTGRSGSRLQLINGVVLVLVFFSARICYGFYNSYDFFVMMHRNKSEISNVFLWVYAVGNVLLNGLNVLWFFKMVTAIKARFNVAKKGDGGEMSRASGGGSRKSKKSS